MHSYGGPAVRAQRHRGKRTERQPGVLDESSARWAHCEPVSSSNPIVLSNSQKRVISYRGGDLRVIACAGSGKTESISRRGARLIFDDKIQTGAIGGFHFTE